MMPEQVRVVYGAAVAGTLIALLVSAITAVFKEPSADRLFEERDQDACERNLALSSCSGIVFMAGAPVAPGWPAEPAARRSSARWGGCLVGRRERWRQRL
jgi:hypothetical protein